MPGQLIHLLWLIEPNGGTSCGIATLSDPICPPCLTSPRCQIYHNYFLHPRLSTIPNSTPKPDIPQLLLGCPPCLTSPRWQLLRNHFFAAQFVHPAEMVPSCTKRPICQAGTPGLSLPRSTMIIPTVTSHPPHPSPPSGPPAAPPLPIIPWG